MTAVQLDYRLVAAFICVVDDPDRLRSHRVADAVKGGNQDEPAGNALALGDGRPYGRSPM
jgi:hypothetical protein